MASLTIDDNSIISDDDYDCSATNIFSSPLTYKYRVHIRELRVYQIFNFFCCFHYFKVNVEFLLKFTYFYGSSTKQ